MDFVAPSFLLRQIRPGERGRSVLNSMSRNRIHEFRFSTAVRLTEEKIVASTHTLHHASSNATISNRMIDPVGERPHRCRYLPDRVHLE